MPKFQLDGKISKRDTKNLSYYLKNYLLENFLTLPKENIFSLSLSQDNISGENFWSKV